VNIYFHYTSENKKSNSAWHILQITQIFRIDKLVYIHPNVRQKFIRNHLKVANNKCHKLALIATFENFLEQNFAMQN
jgi:hypothetical protein